MIFFFGRGSKERSREEALKEIKAEKMLKKEEKREDSERRVREKKAADERSSPSWESSNRVSYFNFTKLNQPFQIDWRQCQAKNRHSPAQFLLNNFLCGRK